MNVVRQKALYALIETLHDPKNGCDAVNNGDNDNPNHIYNPNPNPKHTLAALSFTTLNTL